MLSKVKRDFFVSYWHLTFELHIFNQPGWVKIFNLKVECQKDPSKLIQIENTVEKKRFVWLPSEGTWIFQFWQVNPLEMGGKAGWYQQEQQQHLATAFCWPFVMMVTVMMMMALLGKAGGCDKEQPQQPQHLQCSRYRILPSGLCAEICCNRGKKGLSGRIGTFSGPILEQIGTFCRYLPQNAELLKIMRKHDNPISRREKVHRKTKSLSSKYTHI